MTRILALSCLAGLATFALIVGLGMLAVGPMPVLLGAVLVAVGAIHHYPVRSTARLLLRWKR
ncbi:MAG: hypothetical protein ACYDD0_03640 [Candidatus Dormibacteria bacterium]